MLLSNQRGIIRIIPLLIVIAIVGILSFLLITSTLPFKGQFSTLFPKSSSQAATNQIYWGSWIDGTTYGTNPVTGTTYVTAPWPPFDAWDLFEQHTGKKMSLTHWGNGFPRPSTPQVFANNFDWGAANNSKSRGAVPLVDWGTYGWSDQQIASGAMDTYLRNWAQAVKTNYPHPIFVRLDAEMNGFWNDYGPNNSFNNTAQDFVAMWKHIHDVVEIQSGVTNVTWVWCPNQEDQSVINSPANIINAINWYPSGKDASGHDWVDWTCFDSYNFGSMSGNVWQTWDQIAIPTYNHMLSIAPTKPIMVGETASSETGAPAGTSKGAWITDVLNNLPTKYPQIKAYVWFNWKIPESNTVRDWQIESSTASQNAFAQGIANPYYATNVFGSDTAIPLDTNDKIAPLSVIGTPSPTPTLSPNQVSFIPVADSYTASDAPTSTFGGTAQFLYTSGFTTGIRKTFIRFDLTTLAGKTVTAAILRVHTTSDVNAGSTGVQNVHYLNDDLWQEQFLADSNTVNPGAIDANPMGTLTNANVLNTSYDIPLTLTNLQPKVGNLFSVIIDSPSSDDLVIGSRESTIPAQLILTLAAATPIPSPTPTSTPIVSACQGADIDNNGKVDIFDYNSLVSNFGKTGTGIQGDIDGNGKVDIFDYNLVVANFGKTGC
jgi:hypothetical protein